MKNESELEKVIYIVGAGRSGTTLLDIILGNGDEMFSAGELNRFPRRKGVSPIQSERSGAPTIWSEFKEKFVSAGANTDFDQLQELTHQFEYHTWFFKKSTIDVDDSRRYDNYLDRFYNTLTPLVKEKYIIDSSKYPARAVHLAEFFGKNISFIFLIKDPIQVVSSFQKKNIEQPSKGLVSSSVYYTLINRLCFRAIKDLKKKNRVSILSFDSLVSKPMETMEKLERDLEIDLSKPKQILATNDFFQVGDLFDGNRIAKKEQLKLRPINGSKPEIPKHMFVQILNQNLYKKILAYEY